MRLTIDADGSWRLFDDGSEEMRLAGGPLTARFTARGVVEGRYEPDGDGWAFTHTRATGAASLRLPVVGTTRIPLADVGASSMVPDGRASISCDGDTVTMTSTAAADDHAAPSAALATETSHDDNRLFASLPSTVSHRRGRRNADPATDRDRRRRHR